MEGSFSDRDATHCRFLSLGTMNEIQTFEAAEDALALAEKRVREIDDRMSVFKEESDISRLNRYAGRHAVTLHRDTWQLLALSKSICEESEGAFDITVRPLTALWAIGKNQNRIPSDIEIAKVQKSVGSRELMCDARHTRAYLKKAGQAVDLGGIAKGLAADEVKRILLENGVKSALINLGGNIVAVGKRPDEQPWNIGIQNPAAPRGEFLGMLSATDCAVVTSGSNERFFIKDGERFHHLLDPRTGRPAQSGLLSVTVICPDSVMADALSTALFVGGMQKISLLKKYDAEAIFATEQGKIFATQGLSGQFSVLIDAKGEEYHHA